MRAMRTKGLRMSRLFRLSFFCLLFATLPLGASRADEPQDAPAAAAAAAPNPSSAFKTAPDSEGFVPESRPANMTNVEEGIPAGPLVATAYGFIWLAVLVFVGFTARRASQLESEVAQLAERLSQATGERPR